MAVYPPPGLPLNGRPPMVRPPILPPPRPPMPPPGMLPPGLMPPGPPMGPPGMMGPPPGMMGPPGMMPPPLAAALALARGAAARPAPDGWASGAGPARDRGATDAAAAQRLWSADPPGAESPQADRAVVARQPRQLQGDSPKARLSRRVVQSLPAGVASEHRAVHHARPAAVVPLAGVLRGVPARVEPGGTGAVRRAVEDVLALARVAPDQSARDHEPGAALALALSARHREVVAEVAAGAEWPRDLAHGARGRPVLVLHLARDGAEPR